MCFSYFVASLLLDSLISYLTAKDRYNCKAIYLHVLASNCVAIKFYEKRRFKAHSFLPYYYSIQGKPRDGYLYVLYINGGKPPWSTLYPFVTFYMTGVYLTAVSISGLTLHWLNIAC